MNANDIKNRRIVIASQDITDEFEEEVNEILDALGHPEALVTDDSIISDFLLHFVDKMTFEERNEILKKERRIMQRVEKLVGRVVGPREYIGEIAQERYKVKNEQKAKMRPH